MLARKLARIVLSLLVAVPASAADFYVDVVNGNDANAGTSAASAWKTLTHASAAATPGSATTIHVAPGVYSPSSGEVLPLRFHQQVVVADQGPAVTSIDGQTQSILLEMRAILLSLVDSITRIEGFTLRGSAILVNVSQSQGSITTQIVNCRLESSYRALNQTSGDALGPFTILLRNVTIHGGERGLYFYPVGSVQATLIDCSIQNCSTAGIEFNGQGGLSLSLSRTRIEHSGSGIINYFTQLGGGTTTVEDSLIAHNGDGFRGTSGGQQPLHAIFRRSTVADNTGAGVTITGAFGDAAFDGAVVNGNGTDLGAGTSIASSAYTQVGGPDPQFVDRVNGDYRLRFGSPCVDAADPATAAGTADLSGTARPIDGDLDTNERADIGAYEHTPLRLVTSGQIGAPLRLESSGPAGGTSTIYFTRGAPVAPMATPFGQFDLNPMAFGTLLHTSVAPFPPVAFQRPIPNLPFLLGHTFSFQALTTSSLAPQGSAYTNVVSFTITP